MLHGSIVNCQNTFEVNVYSLLTLSSSPHRHTWTVSLIDLIESFRRFHNGPQSLSEALHESMACDPLAPILWEPHMQALNRRLGIVLESLRDCIEHNSADDVIYPKWNKKTLVVQQTFCSPREHLWMCARVYMPAIFFFTKSMSMPYSNTTSISTEAQIATDTAIVYRAWHRMTPQKKTKPRRFYVFAGPAIYLHRCAFCWHGNWLRWR